MRCRFATVKRIVLLVTLIAVLVAGASTAAAASKCDPLDNAACLLPFPNDAFTRADKTSDTGRRLALRAALMPRNDKGKPIAPAPYGAFDGFSPGSVILTKVAGLSIARTKPVGLSDISRYTAKNAPIVVIDEKTGKRWPIWAELDVNAKAAKDRLLEIHPAKNFLEGHTYVVALRRLKNAKGQQIPNRRAFLKLLAARKPPARYKRIFKALRKAHVKLDGSLFLAWDFTVASRSSLSSRMLHVRDDAFKQLGDTNLADGV